MPNSWSAWVSLVGALIGTLTGVLGLVIAYIKFRRERSDVNVKLTHESHTLKAMLEHTYPGVRFGPHYTTDEPQEWYVVSAVNRGLQPVHVEKAVVVWVEQHAAGSMSSLLPHDVLLNEEHRRTSLAFGRGIQIASELWLAAFIDDTGRQYTAFGPNYRSWWRRIAWKRQRAKLLATGSL